MEKLHPRQVHEGIFASGGSDGAIMFWHVGEDKESGVIENAHESIVWSLAWHPIGHILCSGSNDHTAKFWEVFITYEILLSINNVLSYILYYNLLSMFNNSLVAGRGTGPATRCATSTT